MRVFDSRPASIPITLAVLLVLAFPVSAASVYESVPAFGIGEAGIARININPAGQQLFVAQGSVVSIRDISSGKLIRDEVLPGAITDMALIPDSDQGIVSLGRKAQLTWFDAKTLDQVTSVKTGSASPGHIIYDAASKKIFVSDTARAQLLVLRPDKPRKLTKTGIAGISGPMTVDRRGQLFGVLDGQPGIYILHTVDNKPLGQFKIPGCKLATDIAIDSVERRLFVPCSNGLLFILDSDTGVELGRLATAPGSSRLALHFAPQRTVTIFVASEHALTICRVVKVTFSTVQTIAVKSEDPALAVDGSSGRAYLSGDASVHTIRLTNPAETTP